MTLTTQQRLMAPAEEVNATAQSFPKTHKPSFLCTETSMKKELLPREEDMTHQHAQHHGFLCGSSLQHQPLAKGLTEA
ncbi:hypothetical protein SRHO_G00003590 [Serrasalmus rhombeus]